MSARMNKNTNKFPTGAAKPSSIVGFAWTTSAYPWWVPAGLEATQGPDAKPIYTKSPFFGADREYGPEEGWQVYHSPSYRKRQCRQNRYKNNAYETEDTYEFEEEENY